MTNKISFNELFTKKGFVMNILYYFVGISLTLWGSFVFPHFVFISCCFSVIFLLWVTTLQIVDVRKLMVSTESPLQYSKNIVVEFIDTYLKDKWSSNLSMTFSYVNNYFVVYESIPTENKKYFVRPSGNIPFYLVVIFFALIGSVYTLTEQNFFSSKDGIALKEILLIAIFTGLTFLYTFASAILPFLLDDLYCYLQIKSVRAKYSKGFILDLVDKTTKTVLYISTGGFILSSIVAILAVYKVSKETYLDDVNLYVPLYFFFLLIVILGLLVEAIFNKVILVFKAAKMLSSYYSTEDTTVSKSDQNLILKIGVFFLGYHGSVIAFLLPIFTKDPLSYTFFVGILICLFTIVFLKLDDNV